MFLCPSASAVLSGTSSVPSEYQQRFFECSATSNFKSGTCLHVQDNMRKHFQVRAPRFHSRTGNPVTRRPSQPPENQSAGEHSFVKNHFVHRGGLVCNLWQRRLR
ncbi:hypothetical protein ARMSODRAFT_636234 [Armillaria solidipes]|uniref:Uncharacterized protein n=1 Tax=Armillaria solidipes TaxID=1076256 RepID=A0A2H3C9M6_9AGAR|nr:hypothetical protein ARMSODRAFT_636234 [Armillaria solidipes]